MLHQATKKALFRALNEMIDKTVRDRRTPAKQGKTGVACGLRNKRLYQITVGTTAEPSL